METLGIHHLAVKLRDLERAIPFYRDVLGLPELKRHHHPDGSLRSVWLELGQGAFLALEQATRGDPEGESEEEAGWHLIALRIRPDERARVEAHLEARGVEIHRRSRWTLYVRDPEGNRIGLSHHPEEA